MSCSADKQRIVDGPVCVVDRCAHCGVLHVTIGDAITLRLHPDAVGSIASTLNEVMRRLSVSHAIGHQAREELPS